ncbi:CCA tRNA nucleotidyltransferase [Persicobacter sp. CCB-QB2]|uniref:CCA tRNA nucleotidyltransferase n=1 Tax=Persicobacter sp. CCB-QB2 TaxID=1561025 RepID=UPI0006A98FE7|nr:HD domain-containing protein [Persicobacter sp. CCB-QB2]
MNYKSYLDQIPIFAKIGACADALGVETYVIGGFVRDIILNRPSKDIDIVCVGSGIELAQEVAKAVGNVKVNVFKNFGTAMLKDGDWEVEFVGARKESYNRDSRKPIVEDGTLEDDQNRRDFTINAMAIRLNADHFGDLIDPFDGMGDIERKIIRTPLDPDITFSDDPLRMMRAVRFATQLNFDIDADTFFALSKNSERLSIISRERIADEMNKMILAKNPSYGFKLLFQSRLLHQFFPEMVALQGVEVKNGRKHKDNFYHTLQVLDNVAEMSDDLWLRWAAILHDIAKPPTKRFHPKAGWTFHGHEDKGARMVPAIFRKLKLPMNEKMKMVQKLVRLHLRPIPLVKEEITDSALRRLLFEAGEDLERLMMLCRADITSKNERKVTQYLKNFDIVEEKLRIVEENDQVRNFQPPVSGEDIMEYFDLKPSREVGLIKDAIKEAVLEGEIKNDKEEAFALMIKLGDEMGLKAAK